ncbi:hypothetical protein Vafri_5514, partial [Volvox africanus]
QVTLADGGKHPILGRITLSLSVGPLRITTQPYVLQELTDTATYILGSSTLRQYGASIDMESATLRLRKGLYRARYPSCHLQVSGQKGVGLKRSLWLISRWLLCNSEQNPSQ